MRKWVYLARSFAASSGSIVTADAGAAGRTGVTGGSATDRGKEADEGTVTGGGRRADEGGVTTGGATTVEGKFKRL